MSEICGKCLGVWIVAGGILTWAFMELRKYMQGGKFTKNVSAEGKVVVITGANTGIGKETARDLAKRGAIVYMACRDMQKAQDACNEIVSETGNRNVKVLKLDLSSLKSVREFAENFKQLHQKLDILINNAGVMWTLAEPRTLDGFEMQIGVNHLGHFYLTNLLLDIIKAAAPSRIVNVSSLAHKRAQINKKDLNSEKSYSRHGAYSQSKLANVLFTKELAKRLAGTGVTVNALHPGVVQTELGRYNPIMQFGFNFAMRPFMKTAVNGAQTTLYAALDPDLDNVSGMYFADCKLAEVATAAKDDSTAQWLWDESEKLIKSKIE